MTAIERMNRFGSKYSIRLECGHTIARTPAEIKIQQLYIGKRIGCPWCAAMNAAGFSDPGSYADRHAASLDLIKPNQAICVACRAQAIDEAHIKHVVGCPADPPSDSWMRAATMTPLVKRGKGRK